MKAETALSAPVDVAYGPGGWHLSVRKIARILELPSNGDTELRLAGPRADRFFANLKKADRARAEGREVRDRRAQRRPCRPRAAGAHLGHGGDDPQPDGRAAVADEPQGRPRGDHRRLPSGRPRTRRRWGSPGSSASYTTYYGGVANRIHNVQVVSHLIDNTLIAPGEEFSFNGTTGERNAAKGLLEAPVIINGELKNGLGGGTCQVSTTVFNAAYEAGLPITARTNHALYISHYPQGRDATVNYPDIDLKFVNDTGHWLLLRTFVSSSSLTVNLYGTPQHRRVESETAPLVATGPCRSRRCRTRTERRPDGGRAVGSPPQLDERTGAVYDPTGSCSTTTRGTRATRARRASSTSGRSPSPKPSQAEADAQARTTGTPPTGTPTAAEPPPTAAPTARPGASAAAIASASQAGTASAGGRRGRRRRAASSRRRHRALALEHVLVAEARAAHVAAAGVDLEPVVEERRLRGSGRATQSSAPRSRRLAEALVAARGSAARYSMRATSNQTR